MFPGVERRIAVIVLINSPLCHLHSGEGYLELNRAGSRGAASLILSGSRLRDVARKSHLRLDAGRHF